MVTSSLLRHPLIVTLKSLRGNVRGVVLTEPLWGIPYNLYAPYVSVYMLALGLTDSQIGLVASVGLTCQIFWTMISGAVTDKYGRKRTTLIGDLISWSIPCLIWAVAQDINAFLLAAVINSIWRVASNSWLCLLVEDTDPALLVDVYSLIYISGQLVAFFSPLASLLIAQYSLVPTMRGLYLFAFVMMTAKFVIMNAMVVEPTQGVARMQATQHQSLFSIMRGSGSVLGQILRSPETLVTGGLMVLVTISLTIHNTFWGVLVTEKLQVESRYLAFYYVARSLTMLFFYFMVMPRLRIADVRKPMIFGFTGLILSWSLLILIPPQSYLLLLVATILEGCSIPITNPLLDKLVATTVDPKERARVMSILYLAVLTCTSPFGWIAGQASEISRNLPFVLNIGLFTLAILLAFWAIRRTPDTTATVKTASAQG